MMTLSTVVATYELSTPITTMVIPIAIDFFLKQSLEQIDPFDILQNMIEQIDPFD
jgi:hypothetical protein